MTRRSLFAQTPIRIAVVFVVAATALITIVVAVPRASHALPGKSQADVPLLQAFALLREPGGGPPPRTLVVAAAHVPASFELDVSAARRAASTGAWLIPGAGWLCLAVRDSEGLGISCSSALSAERGELAFEELSSDGGGGTVIGALPDWIARIQLRDGIAGAAVAAATVENTYAVSGLRIGGAVRVSGGALETEAGE